MSTSALARINHRPPTGKVALPCILLAGDEGAGKTWCMYELSKSDRIGWSFAIDLGEGSADEYGPIGDYNVVHPRDPFGGWTFAEFYEQVCAIYDFAAEQRAAGEKLVLLTIDTMSDEHSMLMEAMNNRAKTTPKNQTKLRADPMAELDIPFHIRNETNAKHRRLMTKLLTFPGIVVMTARAKEVAKFENGNPVKDADPIWKPEGHRNLQHDASVVIRMDRDKPAQVFKARSIHYGVRPGVDAARDLPGDWTLERLIFDVLKLDPDNTQVRDLRDLHDDGSMDTPDPDEAPVYDVVAAQKIADTALEATETAAVVALRQQAGQEGLLNAPVSLWGKTGNLGLALEHLEARLVAAGDQQQAAADEQAKAAPATPEAPPAPAAAAPATPEAPKPAARKRGRPTAVPTPEPTPEPVAEAPRAPEPEPTPEPTPEPVQEGWRASFIPDNADDPREVRHARWMANELNYQADVLGVDRAAYAANVAPEGDLSKVKQHAALRFLTSQRPLVIDTLTGDGRTVEAEAYASIGTAYPNNLLQTIAKAM